LGWTEGETSQRILVLHGGFFFSAVLFNWSVDTKRMTLAFAAAPRFLLAAVAALLACAAVGALDPLVVMDVAKGVKLEHW